MSCSAAAEASSAAEDPAARLARLVAPSVGDDEREGVRVAVYLSFTTLARAPTIPWIEREAYVTAPQARRALLDLHETRDLVLLSDLLHEWTSGLDWTGKPFDPDLEDETLPVVYMAHPFCEENLGFSVMGTQHLFWGGCAWDAFAVPHLMPSEAPCLIATRCPGCRAPIAVDVTDEYPPLAGRDPRQPAPERPTAPTPPPGPVAHFATPMRDAWADVVKTCSMQNLFCSTHCVMQWCRREGRQVGYTMDIDTLWRLAAGWYTGRFEHGYKRREPIEAKEYFRKAGLRGSFWGLEDE